MSEAGMVLEALIIGVIVVVLVAATIIEHLRGGRR